MHRKHHPAFDAGVFKMAVELYLEFLFNEWSVKTLVSKTLVRNERGMGAMQKLGAIFSGSSSKSR